MWRKNKEEKIWGLRKVKQDSEELKRLLEMGWEPFKIFREYVWLRKYAVPYISQRIVFIPSMTLNSLPLLKNKKVIEVHKKGDDGYLLEFLDEANPTEKYALSLKISDTESIKLECAKTISRREIA